MRLTPRRQKEILEQNEGYTSSTHSSGKNYVEDRTYTINDGGLTIRAKGKTSWADSRYDDTYEADHDQTLRFLRENIDYLNTEGIE